MAENNSAQTTEAMLVASKQIDSVSSAYLAVKRNLTLGQGFGVRSGHFLMCFLAFLIISRQKMTFWNREANLDKIACSMKMFFVWKFNLI